ncbi:DUF3820 family protein [Polaribacter litorisediminis]|uniref:DUF3820 family protein n=1 Tax=Polaribacter litorisediminis TaxID=1908341 RepID=UPI001CC0FDFC|nr:DUF3820 family protein [Polaribacter litorisediminis]UAM97017.1 DUF3820 family protein [Polaribacter litorisediminis]
MENNNVLNRQFLIEVSKMKMPFGKFKGRFLIDLPEHYIVWYHNKGFPKGKLGQQMSLVYELQLNGLEDIVRKIQKEFS